MMTVAIMIPKRIAGKDLRIFIWRRDATREPVQAPVPGRGIPTKSTSPQKPYFSTCPLCLSAFFRSQMAI